MADSTTQGGGHDPRQLAVLGFAAFTLVRLSRKVLVGTTPELREIAAGVAAAIALARAISARAARHHGVAGDASTEA